MYTEAIKIMEKGKIDDAGKRKFWLLWFSQWNRRSYHQLRICIREGNTGYLRKKVIWKYFLGDCVDKRKCYGYQAALRPHENNDNHNMTETMLKSLTWKILSGQIHHLKKANLYFLEYNNSFNCILSIKNNVHILFYIICRHIKQLLMMLPYLNLNYLWSRRGKCFKSCL